VTSATAASSLVRSPRKATSDSGNATTIATRTATIGGTLASMSRPAITANKASRASV
jgi:hypothetical protein